MIVLDVKNLSLENTNSHAIKNKNERNITDYIKNRQQYSSVFEQAQRDYQEIVENYKISPNGKINSKKDDDFNASTSLNHQTLMKIICKGNLILLNEEPNVVKELNVSLENQNIKIGVYKDSQKKLVAFKFEGTATGKENPNFLGEGNYGTVQKITDFSKGKLLALKTAKTNDKKDLNSIKNEVRRLSTIENSTGLQQGTDGLLTFDQNILGYITKLYNLGSLNVSINVVNTFPEKEILKLIISLYSGLDYLAKNKIVHGDIKPQNCFVNKIGKMVEVVLGDLGGAADLAKLKKSKHFMGTPFTIGYFTVKDLQKFKHTQKTCPESLVNQGSKRDLFALTKTVWFILTQDSPYENTKKYFQGKKYEVANTSKLINENVIKQKIGSDAANILIQCLSEDPNDRPPLSQVIRVLNEVYLKPLSTNSNDLEITNISDILESTDISGGTVTLEQSDENTVELYLDS